MEAREKLTRLGCDSSTHDYLGDGVYLGIDDERQVWLITQRDHGGWHAIALDDEVLARLYRYVRMRLKS